MLSEVENDRANPTVAVAHRIARAFGLTVGDLVDPPGGNGGPTIWVDGRIVGVWAQTTAGEFLSHYFLDVPARAKKAVAAEVDRLRDLVGDTRFSVRFPSPVHKALLG